MIVLRLESGRYMIIVSCHSSNRWFAKALKFSMTLHMRLMEHVFESFLFMRLMCVVCALDLDSDVSGRNQKHSASESERKSY